MTRMGRETLSRGQAPSPAALENGRLAGVNVQCIGCIYAKGNPGNSRCKIYFQKPPYVRKNGGICAFREMDGDAK